MEREPPLWSDLYESSRRVHVGQTGCRADLGGQEATVAQGAADASLTSSNGGGKGYVPAG